MRFVRLTCVAWLMVACAAEKRHELVAEVPLETASPPPPPSDSAPEQAAVEAPEVTTGAPTAATTAPTATPTATAIEAPLAPTPTAVASSRPLTATEVYERAKSLMSRGDSAGARALLEPRVFGGEAAPLEVKLLERICKAAHDAACLQKISHR